MLLSLLCLKCIILCIILHITCGSSSTIISVLSIENDLINKSNRRVMLANAYVGFRCGTEL